MRRAVLALTALALVFHLFGRQPDTRVQTPDGTPTVEVASKTSDPTP